MKLCNNLEFKHIDVIHRILDFLNKFAKVQKNSERQIFVKKLFEIYLVKCKNNMGDPKSSELWERRVSVPAVVLELDERTYFLNIPK